RALIASFPEGRSNRQVWHAVARLAAACVLGNAPAARDAVHGPEGIAKLLATALLDDGSWYEGENYHQFAHRGFWYAFRMAERGGIELAPPLVARFRRGYGVPFRVALPDWTLPARRDSQYAVSLRQWRWAEWCELGIADDAGRSLRRALADLYAVGDPPLPHGTGRWRATGESERNEPASALSRADLGWKSLLFARPELATADPSTDQRSELLAAQGYAILRRDAGRIYAALDFGGGGGGHGHPDRLNVILQDGDARWLDDPGTGTYVERTLHWYRSTLAHAAPLVDGRSQPRGAGALLAFDPGRDGPDAIETKLPRSASVAATTALGDVRFARALVATDAYVVDQLTWEADRIATVDLPFPVDGTLDGVARWTPFEPGGAGGLEDGFDFLHDAEAVAAGADRCRISLDARGATGARASLWLASPGATLWRAVGPGPPGVGQRRFHAVRMQGSRGVVTAVWDLRGTVAGVHADAGVVTVTLANGTVDRHVVVSALDADRVRGEASDDDATSDARPSAPVDLAARLSATWTTFEIGAGQYLRSESSWEDAGAPAATVRLRVVGDRLELDLDVRLGRPPAFAPTGAFNPLDNERADVNSDGLQLLIAPATAPEHLASWLLVPERPAPTVRITPTSPADGSARALTASWRERDDGWTIRCAYPLGDLAGTVVALDLAVNEQPPGRERRRGQLVLGRPDGAFVYLRGDRMSAARALRFRLPPPEPVA
ncbi:MAG TPA: heparinase II/III family protein, partial [Gemmatirosa sp.]